MTITPLAQAYIMAAILWLALVGFAALGGADFGAGVWDLLARTRDAAEEQRGALIRAIGPIWEANELWIIFAITGTWTAFPLVFATVMTALFIPLTVGLIGLVLRGAAFAYYTHFRASVNVNVVWGRAFSAASLVAPLTFGAIAAAIASGHIHVGPNGTTAANSFLTWTSPFALASGVLAIAVCALLAATYMTVEAKNTNEPRLVRIFRRRALISVGVVAALGVVAGWLAQGYAPYLFGGLTTRALPFVLAAIVDGALTFGALLIGWFRLARVLSAGIVTLMLAAWAIAQLPYLVPPDVTVMRAASPPGVLTATIITSIVGMILVLPSIWYMLYLFKSPHRRQPIVSANDFIHQLEAQEAQLAVATAQAAQRREEHRPSNVLRRKVGQGARRALTDGALGLAVTAATVFGRDALQRWRERRALRHDRRQP